MQQGKDFTIDPIKPRKHGSRSDKVNSQNIGKRKRIGLCFTIEKTIEDPRTEENAEVLVCKSPVNYVTLKS